jgi:drug/metabolite transporter (DMT)-like permease
VDNGRLNRDFLLVGLFNALDFLLSNSAFHASAASFVETIKASEPITTTVVALAWQVDRLGLAESACLAILITGVLLSTVGNAATAVTTTRADDEAVITAVTTAITDDEAVMALGHSVRTAVTIMTANLCFAFRALSQKRYRSSRPAAEQLDDINLLCRMLLVGALSLLPAALWIHGGSLIHATKASTENQMRYTGLSMLNAVSFATYNFASCYVLSHVSVLRHSSLNCLRRMFVTIMTSLFFGVKMTCVGAIGITMSFAGFLSFTHYRTQRQKEEQQLKPKDSNV